MRLFASLSFLIASGIAFLMSFVRMGSMPDRLPMHWNLAGQVDRYGSKWEALLFMPFFMVFFALVFFLVAVVSGTRLGERTVRALNIIAGSVAVLLICIHNIVLSGSPMSIPTFFPFMFSGLLIVMGFAIKGVEPNPFVGIRVPWTMNNREVWRMTHDRASKLWMWSGICSLALAVMGVHFVVPVLFFTVAILWPILDSYRISKTVV